MNDSRRGSPKGHRGQPRTDCTDPGNKNDLKFTPEMKMHEKGLYTYSRFRTETRSQQSNLHPKTF